MSQVEGLEARTLLSSLPDARPTFEVASIAPDASSPQSGAFTPAQIQQAYQFNQVGYNGSGETIAIVDAYNDPNIQSDLNTFDTQFGIPTASLTVVNETGGTTLPGSDSTGGWEMEESLDVEWAHAMAPGAKILLVEASSDSLSDLFTAVGYASQHANVVSMSWGAGEFNGETSYDSYFQQAGVAYVVASGDSGAPAEYPAASPDVLAVGGTQLTTSSNGTWSSETGWDDSTGGPSEYETMPSYQDGVVTTGTTMRATPDVAYDASTSTPFAIYDSVPYEGETLDWTAVGGTSCGAPQWSAILAIADQGRAAANLPALNSSSAQQVMSILYQNPGDFHDITSGTSDGRPHYSAGTGYDYVTGLGTPMVNLVVGSLDGSSTTTSPDTLVLSAPSTATAGGSFEVTVTADLPGGGVDTGFTGTITFTSTDGQAVLPGPFTFNSSDDGTATFDVTLKTAGDQKITVADASTSASATVDVSPAKASQLVISGLSSTATAGVAQSVTVTAKDPYGNVATGYDDTVDLSSSDPDASLPATGTFSSGTLTFSVTFETAGSQSVTVADPSVPTLTATQSGIQVSPAAPTGLVATAASSSQINLTWKAAAGATGYEVERSTSASSGFAEIGTATATSYSDTGLTSGTTYYYIVIATGGGLKSANSNTASATTTGTSPTPTPTPTSTESVWGTSYRPTVNAGYDGEAGQTFELGVQFESNVAGVVTGVLFYKQSAMTGTNVGHLWSSNGTLLATATFTNETSSGWQEVSFSQSVSISANTIYTVSYTTGSPLFYYDSGYFARGGVTNGKNLTAPAYTDIGGSILENGVYNYGGEFPDVSQYFANFWVDVAFSPSTTTEAPRKPLAAEAGGSGAGGASAFLATTNPAPTPSGPLGVVTSKKAAPVLPAPQSTAIAPPAGNRPVVIQGLAPLIWGRKTTSLMGS